MKCSVCNKGKEYPEESGRVCNECSSKMKFDQRVSLKIECINKLGG